MVDLALIKKHLNIDADFTDDDEYLTHLLDVATEAVKWQNDAAELVATIDPEWFVYDGEEKKPTVEVIDKRYEDELIENLDYIVEGDTEATEIGEYSIKITGVGKYKRQEVTLNWAILEEEPQEEEPDPNEQPSEDPQEDPEPTPEPEELPVNLEHAILLLIGELYNHREITSDYKVIGLPKAYDYLIGVTRRYTIA